MPSSTTPTDAATEAVLADVQDHGRALLTASELRRLPVLLGPNGRPKDIGYIYRLMQRGSLRSDGTRLRLPHIRGPSGQFATTAEAVHRWLAALNDVAVVRSVKDADAAYRRAEARLAAAGI